MSAACKFYCGFEHAEAHSALEDARACWKVLAAQLQRYPDLPTGMAELADFCAQTTSRFLDSGGWFESRHGQPAFARGKYRGRLLAQVARDDPGYLDWMLGLPDLPSDTEKLLLEAEKPARLAHKGKAGAAPS